MIYLKKFNESKSINYLQELIDNYLAFLKDDGFVVSLTTQRNSYNICIHKEDSRRNNNSFFLHTSDTFSWENIKDYLLPFLQLVEENYKIEGVNFYEEVNDNWENTFIMDIDSLNTITEYDTIDNIQIIINK